MSAEHFVVWTIFEKRDHTFTFLLEQAPHGVLFLFLFLVDDFTVFDNSE